jgi:S1-C subfamily serine protease
MAASLPDVSEAFADAAERAARSTLLIDARARFPATGILWQPGVVVTANHVVERDDNIRVGLPSGEDIEATLAGRDMGSDVAVLRIADDTVAPAARPATEPRVGHLVLGLGRPAHGGHMASLGAISAVGGPWRTMRGLTVQAYLRADITMFPGFSGGPLVDAAGAVIGMNSSALGRVGGLTIPVDALQPIVEALLQQGHVRRGYLGISTQAVRLSAALAQQAGHPHETALLVSGIEPGSPSDAAGVLIGDILVGFESATIASTEDLQSQLGPDRVGISVTLRVVRGGQVATLPVTVGERA